MLNLEEAIYSNNVKNENPQHEFHSNQRGTEWNTTHTKQKRPYEYEQELNENYAK